MTDEQILRKAIEKAIKGGFEFISYEGIQDIDICVANLLIVNRYYMFIFSHDFAKAFWGEKPACKIIPCREWEYNLQMMVLEKEPLKYLEKFL